jgi:chromosome segregation ATPase
MSRTTEHNINTTVKYAFFLLSLTGLVSISTSGYLLYRLNSNKTVDSQSTNSQREEQLARYESVADKLVQQNAALEGELLLTSTILDGATKEIKANQVEITEKSRRIQAMQNDINSWSDQIREKEGELVVARASDNANQQTIANLQLELDALKTKASAADTEIKALQEGINTLTQQLKKVERERDEAEQKVFTLTSNLNQERWVRLLAETQLRVCSGLRKAQQDSCEDAIRTAFTTAKPRRDACLRRGGGDALLILGPDREKAPTSSNVVPLRNGYYLELCDPNLEDKQTNQ